MSLSLELLVLSSFPHFISWHLNSHPEHILLTMPELISLRRAERSS